MGSIIAASEKRSPRNYDRMIGVLRVPSMFRRNLTEDPEASTFLKAHFLR
jgi:hypothetical protein